MISTVSSGHGLAEAREELAGEIRPAPFARAGLRVESKEGVPRTLGEVGAGEPLDLDAAGERVAPLAADRLALARSERAEEILERREAAILPVKLLIVAPEKAALAEQRPLRFRHEGNVRRGCLAQPAQLHQALSERGFRDRRMRAGGDQQAAAGRRRERHRDLQLRIIAAAGALIGVGPAGIEDVFAARMGLEIARRDADDGAVDRLGDEMLRLPAGACGRRFRYFQRRQESVARERVRRRARAGAGGAAVPVRGRDLGDRGDHANAQVGGLGRGGRLTGHGQGRNPSKMIWSAKPAAMARSASLRTVHVRSGKPKI